MNRKSQFLLVLLLLVIVSFVLYHRFRKEHSNALWKIVSQQCVPDQEQHHLPAPCLKVDLAQQYVVYKDPKFMGPVHELVMPSYHVTGIESPELQQKNSPSFFAYAWQERSRLSSELGKPINPGYIALAVNSRHGRSQNQLHIHLACLNPDAYRILEQEQPNIGLNWAPLKTEINGDVYLARRLNGNDLTQENPFKLLNDYVTGQGEAIGDYGLALVTLKDGGLALLATRFNVLKLDLGSAEKIQDHTCALARQ
jgi:CDP-diacylglycerol pyrophosphatase